MVDLPTGKMKSREGTVVDADDLISEMLSEAEAKTKELGKIENFDSEEANNLYKTLGLGALKYFILKVNPQKRMLFNPAESIDFNGHTGPFIQYTYARICSVMKKAEAKDLASNKNIAINQLLEREKDVIKHLYYFPHAVKEAAETYDPSVVANYVYELAKSYNQFYHEIPILAAETGEAFNFRLQLSLVTSNVIKDAMSMLGIDVPERM